MVQLIDSFSLCLTENKQVLSNNILLPNFAILLSSSNKVDSNKILIDNFNWQVGINSYVTSDKKLIKNFGMMPSGYNIENLTTELPQKMQFSIIHDIYC